VVFFKMSLYTYGLLPRAGRAEMANSPRLSQKRAANWYSLSGWPRSRSNCRLAGDLESTGLLVQRLCAKNGLTSASAWARALAARKKLYVRPVGLRGRTIQEIATMK
jgi:hypothetical protein